MEDFGSLKIIFETVKQGLNATDRDGNTPLMWAAKKGHTEVVEILKSDKYKLRENSAPILQFIQEMPRPEVP